MSSEFRSSCYRTDWNRSNTETIRIGLVFPVLAQWKSLYCIDRFDHNINANKSKSINNYLLLRDDYRIGLVISPRVAILACLLIKLIYLLINHNILSYNGYYCSIEVVTKGGSIMNSLLWLWNVKTLFLYSKLCQSVRLDSLSCSFTPTSFLTNKLSETFCFNKWCLKYYEIQRVRRIRRYQRGNQNP
jgi:hypothetical protein